MLKSFLLNGNPFTVEIQQSGGGFFTGISEEGRSDSRLSVDSFSITGPDTFEVQCPAGSGSGKFLFSDGELFLHWNGRTFRFQEYNKEEASEAHSGIYKSPMPGKVIAVSVKEGDTVSEDQPLVIIEAMKMENTIRAAHPGKVKKVGCKAGELVSPDHILVEVES